MHIFHRCSFLYSRNRETDCSAFGFFFTLSTTTPNYSMCFFSSAILFISGMFLGGCENISVGSVPSFVCKRVIQREGSTKISLSSGIMAGVSFHPEYGVFQTESLILLQKMLVKTLSNAINSRIRVKPL